MDPHATPQGSSAPNPDTDPTPSAPPPTTTLLTKVVLVVAILVFLGVIGHQGPQLWEEFQGLQADWESSRLAQPLGFVNITPSPSYAQPPRPWHRIDGKELLIWAGWKTGVGHLWFRIGAEDLDPRNLRRPMGRDVVRAIDQPIVEVGTGEHWLRMQPDTRVVGLAHGGVVTGYPLLLLQKVEAVNDQFADRPFLVVHTPFVPDEEAVDVFDPVVDGQHLTFGLSGLLQGPHSRPLLYDRQSESLWGVDDQHTLVCQAGPRRGTRLALIRRGVPVAWASWNGRSDPRARLIVGAERPIPGHPAPPPTAQLLPASTRLLTTSERNR